MDYRAYILDDEGASPACMSWIARTTKKPKRRGTTLMSGGENDTSRD